MWSIERIEETAKQIVESGQQHQPMVFMIDEKNKAVYHNIIPFNNDLEKEMMIKAMRKMVHVKQIKKYFTVFEGWLGTNPNIRPKRDWNRTEALIISEFNSNLERRTVILKFSRQGKKVKWGERVDIKDEENQCNRWDFYREDVMDESLEQIRKKQNKKDG